MTQVRQLLLCKGALTELDEQLVITQDLKH
jgi:hypothetical protein